MTSNTLRFCVLGLASLAIGGNYYVFDSIAPVAHLLSTQAGLSQSRIGMLNAVFSLPNIPLALVGGVLIDRFGAARTAFAAAFFCCVGAVLTAIGTPYSVMLIGRLLFGIGEETLFIALLAGLALWFTMSGMALAMSLYFSLARVGSYLADTSPSWAPATYAAGWRPALWMAAWLSFASLIAAGLYLMLDRRRPTNPAAPAAQARLPNWRELTRFDASFWYILTLNVLFASAFFPFRSTFAIAFFQDAKGLSLAQAGMVNSWVFFAAIFATPLFGFIADRFGHRAMMLTLGAGLMPLTFLILGATHWSLWISTAMMGVSFSMVPAVIWPATAMLVEKRRLGAAFGLINVLMNLGMAICNLAAGGLNDAFGAGPRHPGGYGPMLLLFGAIAMVAFAAVALLWVRESGPNGHGLNRPAMAPS
jgi:MFS family permease